MPTPIPKYRTYCKSCEDFTLHSRQITIQEKAEKKLLCDKCGTQDSGYNISDVDPKLLAEQRERYSRAKRTGIDLYTSFLQGSGLKRIMDSLEEQRVPIEECDAGQAEIDNRQYAEILAEQQKRRIARVDLRNTLKSTGRNGKCPCNSGKKFKHCHLREYESKLKGL